MQRHPAWTPERALLLVLLVTTAIYWRDLSHDFILDDVPLVLMNPSISSWHNLPEIFRSDIFHVTAGAIHYRPLYIACFLLYRSLFGMVLPWWHLASLLLHLAIILLVYRLGVKILKDKWLAAFAAAVFALHPIHAEPVAYLTATTDLLVALFSLIALLFYLRFREEGGRPRNLVLSVASAAAAMLSKESAGMFPWMLVAYEAFRPASNDAPRGWRRYVYTLPYFAVGAGYVVLRTFLFGLNAGPGPGGSRAAALLDIPLVMLVYARNLFVPVRLSFFYPLEWTDAWTWARAAAVVLVCAAAVLLWRRSKGQPEARILMAWTAVLFVPPAVVVSTFLHDEWVHDRHVYFATVPLCLLLAFLLAQLIRRPRALAAAATVLLALLAVDTWRQVPRFQDEVSVYSAALKLAPHDPELHRYYASALWKYNRHAEALEELRTAIDLNPRSTFAYEDYAGALSETGRDADALEQYNKALALVPAGTPERAQVLYRAASLEIRFSEFAGATAHLREAIGIAPRALNYHATLAEILRKQGDSAGADEELRREAVNRKEYIDRQTAQGK